MNENIRSACGHPDLSVNTNRQFHVVRVPDGPLTRDCFRLVMAAVPEPEDGEVLLKVRYVSIDAASLGQAQRAGTVMAGQGQGEGVDSRHPDYQIGDMAAGDCGWQEYAVLPGQSLVKQRSVDLSEEMVEGFDNLPDALVDLRRNESSGKRTVRIG